MLIIVMGAELFRSSLQKVIHPENMEVNAVTITVLVVSILVKVYMAGYNKRYGKRIDSTAMKATATDSLSDCIATSVVLLSMLLYSIGGINLDGQVLLWLSLSSWQVDLCQRYIKSFAWRSTGHGIRP